jgi:shikimate dehydrogenase
VSVVTLRGAMPREAAACQPLCADIDVRVEPPRLEGVDVLMNATPVGMLDDPRLPIDAARLPPELVVSDAIVKPERTPLLALAEDCGCTVVHGREMMRGQIARIVDFFEARGGAGIVD